MEKNRTYYLIPGILFYLALLLPIGGNAQLEDCTLGMVGRDSVTIIQVFQMRAEQVAKMRSWAAQYEKRSESVNREIQTLLDTHPQSTDLDLENLGRKYKELQQKVLEISMEYDRRLLGIFNEKQYARYFELCQEAARRPMKPIVEEIPKETPEK